MQFLTKTHFDSLRICSKLQVWTVRLDLHVICHEGSLADACSVAGLAALSHFRRPDVTLKVAFMNRKHLFNDPNSFSPAAGRLSNCAPHP